MKKILTIVGLLSISLTTQAAHKLCSVNVKGQKRTMNMKLVDIKGIKGGVARVAASNTGEQTSGTIYASEIGPKASDDVAIDTITVRKVKVDGTVAGIIESPEIMKSLIYELSLENSLAKIRSNPKFTDEEFKSLESSLNEALKTLSCQDI